MVLKVRRQKFKMFLNRNVIWNTNVAFACNSDIYESAKFVIHLFGFKRISYKNKFNIKLKELLKLEND